MPEYGTWNAYVSTDAYLPAAVLPVIGVVLAYPGTRVQRPVGVTGAGWVVGIINGDTNGCLILGNVPRSHAPRRRSAPATSGKSPQGKSLVVSAINIPDFFSRARVYETSKVFNAYEDDRIIGSAACAIRSAMAGPRVRRVGYEFQYLTSPDYRRRGVAHGLREKIEGYLTDQGASLSYALIMEGNIPSMRLFESERFRLHRSLVMPGIAVLKEVQVPGRENIRAISPGDLEAVARLLNETWRGHDLFESPRTTKLDDRTSDAIGLDEIERIII